MALLNFDIFAQNTSVYTSEIFVSLIQNVMLKYWEVGVTQSCQINVCVTLLKNIRQYLAKTPQPYIWPNNMRRWGERGLWHWQYTMLEYMWWQVIYITSHFCRDFVCSKIRHLCVKVTIFRGFYHKMRIWKYFCRAICKTVYSLL